MFSCFRSTSAAVYNNNEFKKKYQDHRLHDVVETTSVSLSISTQLKDLTVRIVHAGGRIEMYQNPIRASTLIQRYPGMCIALPDVFKRPNESVLSADDVLLPGRKYFMVRNTTVEKLKRRDSRRRGESRAVRFEEPSSVKSIEADDGGVMVSEDSFCSAKDFYVSRENWSSCIMKQCLTTSNNKNRPFKPPISRPRPMREAEWEPSLRSIKELSP